MRVTRYQILSYLSESCYLSLEKYQNTVIMGLILHKLHSNMNQIEEKINSNDISDLILYEF